MTAGRDREVAAGAGTGTGAAAGGANADRTSMIVLRSMRRPLFLLIGVYAVGIAGFGLIPGTDGEPMSFFHALYFLSYTATTTGFGELPLVFSDAQRMWAIVLLHVSVVAWLYSIGTIIELLQNPHFRRARSRRVFARRVTRLKEPFVIVSGFGDTGSLLARGLDEQGMSTVVIDTDPDRIKALSLRNFDVEVLGVCADGGDPTVLLDAGLRHPRCVGIVAVTDEESVNVGTTVMTRFLNPSLVPICRVESRERARELESLGDVVVLDSFEVFADRLRVALHRPAVYALSDWLVRMPGVTLDYRPNCPSGRWIVCGYGQMGHLLEEKMLEAEVELVAIDPGIPEEETDRGHLRGSADVDTLERAGIADAAGIIIATDNDAANLRIAMIARRLNARAFTVVRQNLYMNEVVFAALPADIVMHPDRVISRRIELELMSPGLQPLLDELRAGPMPVLEDLVRRLRAALGDEPPLVWRADVDAGSAPALTDRLEREGSDGGTTLGDLVRDARERDVALGCVPLILERDGREHRLPGPDASLRIGDRVLFCSTRGARGEVEAALRNPYTLEYLVTGREVPRGHAARLVRRYRERAEPEAG